MPKRHILLFLCAIQVYVCAEFKSSEINPESRLKQDERKVAFQVGLKRLIKGTLEQPEYDITQEGNQDLLRVDRFAGSFHKSLHHRSSDSTLSAVGQTNFIKLVHAVRNGKQDNFNDIDQAPNSIRVFINPQAGFAFAQSAIDPASTIMPAPPTLSSAKLAAEMLETYINALCRDISFHEYGTGAGTDNDGSGNSLTAQFAAVLNDLGNNYLGPRNQLTDTVDASVLFRGTSHGDLAGPYLSQFLLAPLYPLFPSGCAPYIAGLIGVGNLNQDVLARPQHIPIAQKREFGVSWHDFIALQNGKIPKTFKLTDYDQSNVRYPINGRDIGSYVHTDSPIDTYVNTLNILAYRDVPRSKAFPYNKGLTKNQGDGITMGLPEAYCLIGEVTHIALKAAWRHKWIHLRIRPEACSGLIHHAKITGTNPYNLHSSLFHPHVGVDVLELVRLRNQLQATAAYDPDLLLSAADADTYLLSQMYPEGSPVHPEYPSGHATIAGACVTVIKAIVDGSTKISSLFEPVVVNPADATQLIPYAGADKDNLTVNGELDKLASNIAIGRNFGGVHFRAAGEEGILLGEQVAIQFLKDHAALYHEEGFEGYELTKRDGTNIRITPHEVIAL